MKQLLKYTRIIIILILLNACSHTKSSTSTKVSPVEPSADKPTRDTIKKIIAYTNA